MLFNKIDGMYNRTSIKQIYNTQIWSTINRFLMYNLCKFMLKKEGGASEIYICLTAKKRIKISGSISD